MIFCVRLEIHTCFPDLNDEMYHILKKYFDINKFLKIVQNSELVLSILSLLAHTPACGSSSVDGFSFFGW